MVPFLIWTNYDSPEQEVELTSLNYLSTMALEQAGISLPPYYQFLSDMQECIPAMNARSYYSKSLGTYQEFEYATGEEAMWLHQYEMLQYNGMFDREHRSEVFYSY